MLKKFILQVLNIFYPLVKKILPFQVYAYLAVGAANTVLNIGLFIAIHSALDNHRLAVEIATLFSFTITVISGFWLNKNFAFADAPNAQKENVKQFGKYFLVSIQGQFLDYLITKGLIVLLSINPVVAYLISTIVMLTLTYFLQKYFTFKKHNTSIS